VKTAIVIGATGLVGTQLVRLLLTDNYFRKVIVFVRRSMQIRDDKLEEHLIDFDKPETWQHLVKGDVLFSTLGTTIKQAGSQQAQYRIDYFYQYQFAQAAAHNDVPVYVLVSSAGANPDAVIFYSRMKGELEKDVKQLKFSSINIIQPGLLAGERKETRRGEKVGYLLLQALNKIGLFKKYRPIDAAIVAQAMINASKKATKGVQVYTLEAVFQLAL
jgi:uncharacterized protein YbjT (DUF2867 family)